MTTPQPVTRRAAFLLICVMLAGWALRLVLLDPFPLREDEAIYSVWARAALTDPWYLSTWPDKPPLFLWMQSAALTLFGTTAPGARVLSIAASTLTIALAAAAARRLFPAQANRAAALAALLLACSPFAISFAPTGYTDSLLVFWGTLALALILRGRALGAGMALAAAAMTKQQGLLFVPLIAALPLTLPPPRSLRHTYGALLAGAALVALPILLWDAARWATAPSPWDLGARNYGALALATAGTLTARLRAWGDLLWYMAASPWAWASLAAAVAAGLVWARVRITPAAALLGVWSLGFLAVHLLTTVQPWDRYLLPLAPVLAILAGGMAALLPLSGRAWAAIVAIALLLLLPPALAAARGNYPIGADHGDLAGLDESFAWVAAQPEPAVLYHRTLGWQARFALADAVAAGQTDLRWFPHAVYLADNAAKTPHKARLLIEPDGASTPGLRPALAARGLALRQEARFSRMAVYSIVAAAPAQACAWCLCRLLRGPDSWQSLAPAAMTPLP